MTATKNRICDLEYIYIFKKSSEGVKMKLVQTTELNGDEERTDINQETLRV